MDQSKRLVSDYDGYMEKGVSENILRLHASTAIGWQL